MTTLEISASALLLLALFAVFMLLRWAFDDRGWRNCIRCDCWFDEKGSRTWTVPFCAVADDTGNISGVCSECSADLNAGRVQ